MVAHQLEFLATPQRRHATILKGVFLCGLAPLRDSFSDLATTENIHEKQTK